MALLDTTIIKVIIPKSYINSVYEDYEWLLEWYSDQGVPVYYLFNDWVEEDITESTPINIATDDIKSLPNANEINVQLVAEDINRCDIGAFKALKKQKNVARIMTDGTRERVSIKSGTIRQQNSNQKYNIELEVQRRQPDLIL